MIIFLSLLILCIIFLIFIFRNFSRSLLMTSICTFFLVYFMFFPKSCINSTLSGVHLFFFSVFPSLFPFVIMCNLLICYNGAFIYSKLIGSLLCKPLNLNKNCSLSLIISAFCGYPLGAKYCLLLYSRKIITLGDCQRLLNIASNASPIFIIGYIGSTLFNSTFIGYLLLTSNYLSCILMALTLRNDTNSSFSCVPHIKYNETPLKTNFGIALKDSIDNAIKTSFTIGGYIVVFSILIDIISQNLIFNYILIYTNPIISNSVLRGILLGFIEITNGSSIISTSSSGEFLKIIIIAFLLGFGGLSVNSQVYAFTYKYPEINMFKYLKRKLLQGVFCSIFSFVLYLLYSRINLPIQTLAVNNTFNNTYYSFLFIILFIPVLKHLNSNH